MPADCGLERAVVLSTCYGILSTYPPTQCGLATFSAALIGALRSPVDRIGVVSVVDTPGAENPAEVEHLWVRHERDGAQLAAAALNEHDVAIVQHEYGIFPGPDGADVVDVVRALTVPAIVVLHTVLTDPTANQRYILEELGRLADSVVVMTQTARTRLAEGYRIDPAKVTVIPHGAEGLPADRSAGTRPWLSAVEEPVAAHRPTILTWGLLGHGKGIEWAIEAIALVGDLEPSPVYRVLGQTHPKVLEHSGEAYREELIARAARLGVADRVEFDNRYLSSADLRGIVADADLVLLPYDSREQVTSGVLIEAVAAGKPVISTGFPHAVELLSGGAGLLVDRQDPAAIAGAVRRVLTEPGLARTMATHARRLAPDLLWSAVGARYRTIAGVALSADLAQVSA